MNAALAYKPHHLDTADLAYEFIEQEVGRLDWLTNWPKFKANNEGQVEQKVRTWLDYLRIEHDPKEIVDFIDDMAKRESGRWR